MLDLIKNLVTRPADTVESARAAVEDATSALQRIEAKEADAVAAARATFEANPDDDGAADALARAENRADVKLRRARETIANTQANLAEVERRDLEARIAAADAVVKGLPTAIQELVPQTEPHIRALIEILEKRAALIREARQAAETASRLRGDGRVHIAIAGVNSNYGLLDAGVCHLVSDYRAREQLMELFQPGVLFGR